MTATRQVPPLRFMLGGPYAYVFPRGHETMKLGWDLFSGDVEAIREGTQPRVIARGVKNKAKFRAVAEGFFGEVFAD